MAKKKKGRRPGAGRPNELGESKIVAVRLPVSLIKKLEAEASARDLGLSSLIRLRLARPLPRSQ